MRRGEASLGLDPSTSLRAGWRGARPHTSSIPRDAAGSASATKEPDDPGQQQDSDDRVEFMEVLAERAPVLAEFHAEVGQRETPGPRSEESIDVEFAARHAGDSGGQRDKCADHGQQARNEHGHISPALKEAVSPVQFAAAHQDPASVALDQRASAVAADFVGDERAQIASDRAGRRRPDQLHRAGIDEVAGEGHDQFGRQRNARGLNRHEQRDAGIAGRRHEGIDEDEKQGEDFFGHAIGVPG